MTSPASTTARLLRLLSLLQTRRDWPGTVLADRLDITPRTVRRDVDRLREMGYSIRATMGPDGGYRLDAGEELPPLLFDDDQVIALAMALQSASLAGAGVEEAALRALSTVRQVLPSRLRHRVDALQFTTMPSSGGEVASSVLVELSTAVRSREVLRFDYLPVSTDAADPTAPTSPPRRVEPHHLTASRGRWYLVGWDLDRDDWRTFRADRITPKSHTGAKFTPRELPGGVNAYLSVRFRGSDQADTWPCLGTVILKLPASAVLPFAGEGTVEDLGPERCSLSSGSWSWGALAASLGRFEAEMEVVGPPELAAAFGELGDRFARAAERPSTTPR